MEKYGNDTSVHFFHLKLMEIHVSATLHHSKCDMWPHYLFFFKKKNEGFFKKIKLNCRSHPFWATWGWPTTPICPGVAEPPLWPLGLAWLRPANLRVAIFLNKK
jgi:hypothetical protein